MLQAGRSGNRILAELSKARICGRSLFGVPGSNSAGGMNVFVVSKDKEGKMQDNQEKERTADEVQSKTKYNPGNCGIFLIRPDRSWNPTNPHVQWVPNLFPGGKTAGTWP